MIIDASALIAILRGQPEARRFSRDHRCRQDPPYFRRNYVEAAVIIDASRNPIASRRFDDFCRVAELVVESVTAAQAQVAREAYRDFGKGSRHAASLNFGDCFADALAKSAGEPLLFKGKDFTHTDITSAL